MLTPDQVHRNYTRGIVVYALAYALLLFASIYLIRQFTPADYVRIGLAIVTSLPIGGTILVFLEYIRNCDEFLRAQTTETFIKATGITFFFTTVWGFAENFTGTRLIEFYMVYPIFWACFGLVQGIKKVKV
jgi:hypothetical protein